MARLRAVRVRPTLPHFLASGQEPSDFLSAPTISFKKLFPRTTNNQYDFRDTCGWWGSRNRKTKSIGRGEHLKTPRLERIHGIRLYQVTFISEDGDTLIGFGSKSGESSYMRIDLTPDQGN